MTRLMGIDLGSRSIKIAEIDATPKSRILLGLFEVPRFENESVGETLRKFLQESGWHADRTTVGIGNIPLFTHKLSFPFSDRKRLIPAVSAELEDLLPFEIDSQVLDVQLLKKIGRQYVFRAGLVSEPALQDKQASLEVAGVSADALLCDAEALGQFALRQGLPASASDLPYLVVDFGFSSTKLALLKGSAAQEWNRKLPGSDTPPELLEFKTLAHGAWTLIRHLMDKRQLSFPDAEQWLMHRAEIKQADEGQLSDEISDDIKNGLRPIIVELFQALQGFRANNDQRPQVAYVTGPFTKINGFLSFLSDELQLNAHPWPLGLGLDLTKKSISPAEALSFATALSLATRYAMPKAMGWLNFRRSSAASKKLLTQWIVPFSRPEIARPLAYLLGAWVAVIAYAFGVGHFLSQDLERTERELASELRRLDRNLGNSAERISKDLERATAAVTNAGQKKEKEFKLQQGSSSETAHSDIWLVVARALPETALLKSLEVKAQGAGAEWNAQVLPTPRSETQITEIQNQIQNTLNREGMTGVKLNRKGPLLVLSGKLLKRGEL